MIEDKTGKYSYSYSPYSSTKINRSFNSNKIVYKGQLKGLKQYIIIKMLNEQTKQGNKYDISVFEKNRYATKSEGGFNWEETKEGFSYWENLLIYGKNNFIIEKKETSIVTLSNGDKYLVVNGAAFRLDMNNVKSTEWINEQSIIKRENL